MRRVAMMGMAWSGVAVAFGAACARSPRAIEGSAPSPAATVSASRGEVVPSALANREWTLVQLGGADAPLGAGGRAATLTFDDATMRAAGFAGCNRYSGSYTLVRDSLAFGAAVSTKMACADGMDLEQRYPTMLPGVTGYRLADSTLTLRGASGDLAVFRIR